MKLKWPLLTSIAVHAAVMASFWLWPESPPPSEKEIIQPVTLAMEEKGRHPEAKPKDLKLKDLLPTYNGIAAAKNRIQGTVNGEPDTEEKWGDGGYNLFRHLGSASQLQRIADEFDNLFRYPDELVKRRISGTISARLYFKPEGGCNLKRTTITRGQPYLQFYVFSLIKKVCGLAQIERIKLSTTDHADLSFNFRVVRTGEAISMPPRFMAGNVLAFERQAERSWIQATAGPLTFFPPGPYNLLSIDFQWFAEEWDRLSKGKDPLDAFRE